MTSHIKLHGLAAALLLAAGLPAYAADAAHYDVSSLQDGQSYSRFIVVYRDGSTERASTAAAAQAVSAAAARAKLDAGTAARGQGAAFKVNYGRKLSAIDGELVHTSRALSAAEARGLVEQLAADPAVEFVQPDYLRHALDTATRVQPAAAAAFGVPNDPYYASYQWDYLPANGATFTDSNGASVANWGGANIQQAWSLADGSGVTIASLDTGVTQHPDLNLSLADAGYDFTSDPLVSGRSSAGRIAGGWDPGDWTTGSKYLARNGGCVDSQHPAEDSSWHGTHVFGTVGGERTNNSTGMVGTAFNAQVVPVRVLGHCGGYDSDIIDAITWASGGSVSGVPANAHPAQVISMSLGGDGTCSSTSAYARAISAAIARGATVVAAAGNANVNVSGSVPANCPGVIAVAATGITSKRAFYSNYGSGITLAAPGGGVYTGDNASGSQVNTGFIWSTINAGTTTPTTATYGGMAGTSQATPHVAGVVALMQSYRKALGKALLSSSQVTSLLKSTATAPHVAASTSKPIGAGLLNAAAAVQAAGSQP